MSRKKAEPDLDELVADVAAINNSEERLRGAAKLRRKVVPKKKMGAPTKYTKEIADTICKEISNGKTLTSICEPLNLCPDSVYEWMKQHPDFAECYQRARESMARTLLDDLIDEAKKTEPDRALLLKTKGAILQWAIARFNPREFSDTRKLELKAEVNHKHSHELTPDQKAKIATAWMLSQQNDLPVIESEPVKLLESDSVGEICEPTAMEIPKRKRTALIQKQPEDDF